MAKGFTVQQTIYRSPEQVWAYLTDFSHVNQWTTGVDEMKQITAGPLAVGTTVQGQRPAA